MKLGPRTKIATLTTLGVVRLVFVVHRGSVAMLSVSRSGSVRSSLVRPGGRTRAKNWTARRDHRKFLERLEEARRR